MEVTFKSFPGPNLYLQRIGELIAKYKRRMLQKYIIFDFLIRIADVYWKKGTITGVPLQ